MKKNFINDSYPCFFRSGSYNYSDAGIWYFGSYTGGRYNSFATRSVLS